MVKTLGDASLLVATDTVLVKAPAFAALYVVVTIPDFPGAIGLLA